MNDLLCWHSKFKYCDYSEKLLKKLSLINIKATHKVNLLEIKKAIYYARKYHGSQTRQTGELYYSHPLAVAEMVADYCFKTDILVTSILHDVIEDTVLTKKMIENIFDSNIAAQVDALTRVQPDGKISSAKLIELLLLQKKEELLLIKYFDRIHNMQTIAAKSPEKILKISEETAKHFISLILYLKSSIPDLFHADETIVNLCYQQLAKRSLSDADNLIMSFEDNFLMPFLTFQNEENQT